MFITRQSRTWVLQTRFLYLPELFENVSFDSGPHYLREYDARPNVLTSEEMAGISYERDTILDTIGRHFAVISCSECKARDTSAEKREAVFNEAIARSETARRLSLHGLSLRIFDFYGFAQNA